jgi:hypothetical protein
MSSPWLAKIKKLDVYTKTNDAVYKRHSLGGVFAILVFILMFVLFVSEFSEWLQPRSKDTLSVDVVRNEKLTISFDITFHRLICDDVTIDLLDESGAHFSSTGHHVRKIALDANGNELHTYFQERLSDAGNALSFLQQPGYCHDCLKELPAEHHEEYTRLRKANAVPVCCNTCPLVVMAFQILKLNSNLALTKLPCRPADSNKVANEVGCRTEGYIDINKIGGNFHVAAGRSGTQDHGTHTHHMHRVNFETLKGGRKKRLIPFVRFKKKKQQTSMCRTRFRACISVNRITAK